MVSSARQAIACILLMFGSVIYARAQTAADKTSTASISGKVTLNGKGVSRAGVSLTLREPTTVYSTRHRVVTDDEGNYRITNVPPGSYLVMIAAPAFAMADESGGPKAILVSKGETVDNVDFALRRGAVITGRVTDSDGRPLIEENVHVLPVMDTRRPVYHRIRFGRTDDRGIYRIFGLPPGNYRVAVGQEEGDFGERQRAGYKRTFHPDTPEAAQGTVIELKEGGEATNVDITVGRPVVKYFASGRIIDGETGKAVANVPYAVQMYVSANSTSSMSNGAVSDSDGVFKLEGLVPGKYAVFLEPPPNSGLRADYLRFEISDHDVTGLIVKTSKGGSASGVVVLEGTTDKAVYDKLIKGQLYAFVENASTVRSSTPTTTINPDGSFHVAGLAAGLLTFGLSSRDRLQIVRTERDGVVYPRGVEIKESEQLTGLRLVVNQANGTLRGVVKFENGTPSPDGHLNVSLKRLTEDVGPSFGSDNPQLDARGQFFADGLVPGTYEVTAAYAPDVRTPWRRTTQQVGITNGVVTNITLTIDLNAPLGRP